MQVSIYYIHACQCVYLFVCRFRCYVLVCASAQRKRHSYTAHSSNKFVVQNILSAQCQLYNFSHNIVHGRTNAVTRKKCGLHKYMYMYVQWHHLWYVSHHIVFSIHMQVLNDGYIHPIHPPWPFPLHCSSVKRKGGVLKILVILSFVI